MSQDHTQSPQPRLEVRNLTRRFGDREVVSDVSFSVAPGQVTCLLGPSGCGKSTTLRMIAGVDRQTSGEVYVDGEMICGPNFSLPPEKRRIGLMFQDFALFPHLSVADNVSFGLEGSKAEKRARVAELLEKVGLAWAMDDFPHMLSGGEQQRVALARALAPRPRIMLMAEPFSGLDNRLRGDIRDETLALLKENVSEDQIEIVDYLKDGLSEEEVKSIAAKLDMNVESFIRKNEADFKPFKTKELTEADYIRLLIDIPKLLERPIVIKDTKAIIGRPPENVKDLF